MNLTVISNVSMVGLGLGFQVTTVLFSLLLAHRIPFPGVGGVRLWSIASLSSPLVSMALFHFRHDDVFLRDWLIFCLTFVTISHYFFGFLALYQLKRPRFLLPLGVSLMLMYGILLMFHNTFWIRVFACSALLAGLWIFGIWLAAVGILRQEGARLPIILMFLGALLAFSGSTLRASSALEQRELFMAFDQVSRFSGVRFFLLTLVGTLVGSIGFLIACFERVYQQARQAESRDDVTDLPKRRFVEEAGQAELVRLQREGRSLVVVMIDIDGFRQISRVRGYVVGREVQRALARLLRPLAQREGLFGRFSDGLFCLVLPNEDDAEACGRMLVGRVGSHGFDGLPRLSVCCGVVLVSPRNANADFSTARQLAMTMLSDAKREGPSRFRTATLSV